MTWLTDIGEYLQDNGFGIIGIDIFYGNLRASVPNCVALRKSTGRSTKYTLRKDMKLVRPQLIVKVRNKSQGSADQTAESIYNLLNGVFNTVIGETRFKSIKDLSPPFPVTQSLTEGYSYSIYFNLEIG